MVCASYGVKVKSSCDLNVFPSAAPEPPAPLGVADTVREGDANILIIYVSNM